MIDMKTATKQTAANNAFLAAARKLYNAPIYKLVLAAMNDGGQAAAALVLTSRGMSGDPAAVLAGIGR